jgi:hypothetical protein
MFSKILLDLSLLKDLKYGIIKIESKNQYIENVRILHVQYTSKSVHTMITLCAVYSGVKFMILHNHFNL